MLSSWRLSALQIGGLTSSISMLQVFLYNRNYMSCVIRHSCSQLLQFVVRMSELQDCRNSSHLFVCRLIQHVQSMHFPIPLKGSKQA